MNQSPSNATSTYPAHGNIHPWPICLVGARSKHHQRIFSSLGPLIRLNDSRDPFSFALLYCAHTSDTLKGKVFYFSRLHHADGLLARKYHTFSDNKFNDLAIAHTSLPEEYYYTKMIKTSIKQVTPENIGDEIRIISSYNANIKNKKIKAIQEGPSPGKNLSPFRDLIQLDAEVLPGESGSPVLTMSNELIGLITRTDKEGYSYCNSLYKAKPLLYTLYKNTRVKPDLDEIYLLTE